MCLRLNIKKLDVQFLRLISAVFSLKIFQANKIREHNINRVFFISILCPNIDQRYIDSVIFNQQMFHTK